METEKRVGKKNNRALAAAVSNIPQQNPGSTLISPSLLTRSNVTWCNQSRLEKTGDCQRQTDPGTSRARAAFCALAKLAQQPRRFWGMPGMWDRAQALFYPKGQTNN